MNKDQVKGVAEKAKGKVNQAVGNVTNDPARQAKGDLQEAAGMFARATVTPRKT